MGPHGLGPQADFTGSEAEALQLLLRYRSRCYRHQTVRWQSCCLIPLTACIYFYGIYCLGQHHLSWRTMKRLPRTCRWLDVENIRYELTLYRAQTGSVRPGIGRARVLSFLRINNKCKIFIPREIFSWFILTLGWNFRKHSKRKSPPSRPKATWWPIRVIEWGSFSALTLHRCGARQQRDVTHTSTSDRHHVDFFLKYVRDSNCFKTSQIFRNLLRS